MKIQIEPLQEQINTWIERHVPEKDLFFLKEQDLIVFKSDLEGAIVIPRKEFFGHSSYNGIQWMNSYMYWTISKDVQYVIIAQANWINTLPREQKESLLRIQHHMGRGLLFSLSYFSKTDALNKEYIFKEGDLEGLIIRRDMWMKLPYSYKEEAIKAYAQEYDDWTSMKISTNLPAHLKKYANTFSTEPGANCLAAVLYAISANPLQEEWIIHEWIHEETFTEGLKNKGYIPTAKEFTEGDIVAWVNEEETIQHAAYCIDGQMFFNKNGQTFYNPWKIVHWDELSKEWERYTPRVYRKSFNE